MGPDPKQRGLTEAVKIVIAGFKFAAVIFGADFFSLRVINRQAIFCAKQIAALNKAPGFELLVLFFIAPPFFLMDYKAGRIVPILVFQPEKDIALIGYQ